MGVFLVRGTSWGVLQVIVIPLIIILAVGGGFLNRLRGGWKPWPREQWGSDVILHDGYARAMFAVPTGLMAGIAMLRIRRGLAIGLLFAILTFFSYFVGWGVYFSMGRDEQQWTARVGVFDWLVGRVEESGYDFPRRWMLDTAGMCLRGLVQTAPTGLMLFHYGYGWLPMASGVMFGFIYSLTYLLPIKLKNFSQGTAAGEFVWGYWIWATLLTTLIALYRPKSRRRSSCREFMTAPALNRCTAFFLHAYLILLDAVFIISCVSYGMVKQHDPRNRDQTLLGMVVSTVALLVGHVLVAVRQISCRWRRPKSGMYDWTPINDNARSAIYGSLLRTNDEEVVEAAGTTSAETRRLRRQGAQLAHAHGAAFDPHPHKSDDAVLDDQDLWPAYDHDKQGEDRLPTRGGPASTSATGLHSSLKLFASVDAGGAGGTGLPERPEGVDAALSGLHAALCIPPNRTKVERNSGLACIADGKYYSGCPSAAGVLHMFCTVLVVIATLAAAALVVISAVRNNHYFGCVPTVACEEGPWPSS